MSIEVIDFNTEGKAFIGGGGKAVKAKTISEVKFVITIKKNHRKKELEVHIPCKYCFDRGSRVSRQCEKSKAKQYDLLIDYLWETKGIVKQKWHLTEDDYMELIVGLEGCMYKNYATCNFFNKLVGIGRAEFNLFLLRLARGIKEI